MNEPRAADAGPPEPKTAPPGDGLRRKQPWFGRPWLRVLCYAVFGYLAWCTTLYFFQTQMIFPAGMAPAPRAEPRYPQAEILTLELERGGTVPAWFIPPRGADADTPRPVVVFFHGNAETIDYQDFVINGYHRMGVSVLLPEYRGYGHADGKPSEAGIVADAVRFHDLLVERGDVDASRLVFHGRSLGTGVAAQLAARREPSALILESAFTSVAAFARRYAAPTFLARHPFRTDQVLPELDVPVLLFHGTRDRIVPVHHGRALRDLARDATWVEYDTDHNTFPGPGNRDDYWSRITDHLRRSGVLAQD